MKTYAEQLGDIENTRGVKMARLDEILKKITEEGRDFDESEKEEFDELKSEIKQLEGSHQRIKEFMQMQAGNAVPVDHEGQQKAVDKDVNKSPMFFTKKADPDDKFEGQTFVRLQIAKALAWKDQKSPIAVAEKRWGKTHPNLVEYMKADVAGHGSGSGEAGSEIVINDKFEQDFIEYLYGQTIYNQLPLRVVPHNITIGEQDGAMTGYWVGESKAIPVTVGDYNSVTLTRKKVAAISVCSREWLEDASTSGEMLTRDSLAEAAAKRIDDTFVSNTVGTATTPAGILYNVAANATAGTDGDSVANDFKELMYSFTAARNAGGAIYIVMNPALATGLSLLRNALDQYEFPTITRTGGTIYGMPVIVGDNVNANYLIMIKPSDVYRIGQGGLTVSMSDTASIEMANNPAQDTDTPTAATGKVVNMFQTESVAFKVVQDINFQRRRESAVAWISDADYGGAIST